jgi:anti-sigma B factor antagonist
MSERFNAAVRADGDTPVIELAGQIDADAESGLLAAWSRAAPGAGRVVLDFGGADYINSTGLALIVQVLARARAQGTEVHAFGLSDHYREIFEITRLADFVTLHGDRAAALA